MKRTLLVCLSILALLASTRAVNADELQLTLDLVNNVVNDAFSGGRWQLFARKLETSSGAEGDFGVASVRALLENVDVNSISFSGSIGQGTTGGPYIQTLANGTVELIYEQDLNGTVVTGVGVPVLPAPVTRDTLIASGSWSSGPRPAFGMDPDGLVSTGAFLASPVVPYSTIFPDRVYSETVTLGDLNGSHTVSLLDNGPFLLTNARQLPYHPAADLNQSGNSSTTDRALYVQTLATRAPGMLTIAAEPTGSELGSFYFGGDVGPDAIGETGTIEIRIDLAESDNMLLGGIEVGIQVGTPGVIEFINAEIVSRSRWAIETKEIDNDSVQFFSATLQGGGLPTGAQGQLYATVDYVRVGPGWTPLTFRIGAESVVNGLNYPANTDVTQNYAFQAATIGVAVPEPSTTVLIATALFGLAILNTRRS